MEIESLIWQEGWTPTTDLEVTHIMNLMKEKEKQMNRVVKSAKDEIAYLAEIGKEAEDKFARLQSRAEYLLEQYIVNEVDEEDKKETKTQIKYKLARGEIVLVKPSRELLKPTAEDEAILEIMYPDCFVEETKTTLKWAELKKRLTIGDDGKVVDKELGTAVTNIPVGEVAKNVKIKLK